MGLKYRQNLSTSHRLLYWGKDEKKDTGVRRKSVPARFRFPSPQAPRAYFSPLPIFQPYEYKRLLLRREERATTSFPGSSLYLQRKDPGCWSRDLGDKPKPQGGLLLNKILSTVQHILSRGGINVERDFPQNGA